MTGLCGALRPAGPGGDEMVKLTRWTGQERRSDYDDASVWVASTSHPVDRHDQPAVSPDDGAFVWTTGSLYGTETPYSYEPRTDADPDHVYCARLHGRYGLGFAGRANGTYAAVVYEPEHDAITFVTDRLGTHPIYYAWTDDGGLVFSTQIQALVRHPGVETALDPAGVDEYCKLGRVAGVETPLEGVKQFPPASITHVRIGEQRLESKQYWRPVHEPVDRPFGYFVDRYTDLVRTVLDERFDENDRVGLLLSGGCDSRLLLSCAPPNTTCYHLSDWMSDEARAAERAALTAGHEFEWLQRSDDYHERTLDRAAGIMNFAGRFEQAHIAGFLEEIQADVDVLVSGLYADCFFRALTLPRYTLSLGPLGRLTLPFARDVDSIETYFSLLDTVDPSYATCETPLRETLRSNVERRRDGSVVDHGVAYDSFREYLLYGDVFPLTNDPDLFYWSLEQAMPHWTPFLDNRLIDLALKMPVRYQLRRNVSNAAIRQLSPSLAEIPHGATGVSLERSFPVQYLGENLTAFKRKFLVDDTPPQPYYRHHPWTHYPELLRQRRFPWDRLRRHREVVEGTDALDWEGVVECYDAHVAGEHRAFELYTLLSLLEMPATRHLAVGDDAAEWATRTSDSEGVIR